MLLSSENNNNSTRQTMANSTFRSNGIKYFPPACLSLANKIMLPIKKYNGLISSKQDIIPYYECQIHLILLNIHEINVILSIRRSDVLGNLNCSVIAEFGDDILIPLDNTTSKSIKFDSQLVMKVIFTRLYYID